MYNIFLVSLISILTTLIAYSKDFTCYESRWQTKPTFGINIPITKLLKGDVTDNLISFDNHTYYWQILSLSYFRKRWGIEFNYQAMSSNRIPHRDERFIQYMNSTYEDDYYVTPFSSGSSDKVNVLYGSGERGFLGIIYRFESKRFFVYPKFSVGVTSFIKDSGYAFLKEKNNNKVIEVSYTRGKRPSDHFTLAPSLSFGYKLSKRVFVNIDLLTSYFKTNFSFTKTTTDLNSGQSTAEVHKYKRDIFTFGVGTGFILVIR